MYIFFLFFFSRERFRKCVLADICVQRGSYDPENKTCICDDGFTGQYCQNIDQEYE